MHPMSIEFEWDPVKSVSNVEKHGVTFDEALSVFRDPLAKIFSDPDHSLDEDREIIIGHSSEQRLLVICFTQRADRSRLITARSATRQERQDYEQNTN